MKRDTSLLYRKLKGIYSTAREGHRNTKEAIHWKIPRNNHVTTSCLPVKVLEKAVFKSRQRNPQCIISIVFTKFSAYICFPFLERILILVFYTNQNPSILRMYFPLLIPTATRTFPVIYYLKHCRRLPPGFVFPGTNQMQSSKGKLYSGNNNKNLAKVQKLLRETESKGLTSEWNQKQGVSKKTEENIGEWVLTSYFWHESPSVHCSLIMWCSF